MGDSETVVAQASAVMEYTSADYSVAKADPDSAPEDTGDLDTPIAAVEVVANATPDESNVGDVNMGDAVLDSADKEAIVITTDAVSEIPDYNETVVNMADDVSENPESIANASESQGAENHEIVTSNGVVETTAVAFAGANENGISSDDVHGSVTSHQLVDTYALSPEEERLWSIVRANSSDFNAWTALIEETERMSEENIFKIRKVYDTFLAEFPLCYGYWKKYADHEARLGSIDKVVEVYERAVQGVTYSVDMWLHYCVFSISTYGDPDIIRRLFERGLTYVGTDYLSFPLWDKYIEYEYSQQEWSHLAMIYTRILESPNQQLDRYFTSFRELVASRPLSELRTGEEAAATVGANLEAGGIEIEGEVPPNTGEQSPTHVSAGLAEAEELEKYITIREEMYNRAKEFDSKIIGFETSIRRPYFHVRPLNVQELENWHNYLNFIEGGDDFNKVVKLYERCLIACANYPEYWIRYVLCMEASGSMDLAENALARATQVFVKRQPEIHLFAARFRESSGDISGSRSAYQLVHSEISPGLLEAIIKHANMEHRLGNLEDACSLYEQAIAIEKGKELSQTLPLLYAQYSRFLYLVSGNVEKSREIFDRAFENDQLSKPLLEALIHFESIQSIPKRIDYLDSLVERFIVPGSDYSNVASVTEREELSSIFLEFLDLFGDKTTIKKADDRHAKLFLHHKSASESKKRHADDFLVSEKTKLAKSGGVISPAPSVMGAYQSAQNQWPAGYAVQPQGYPQAAPVQGQQYNAGYAQQAAYGAYNSYGSTYAQPQVPTSAPQTAAYGAYPPTYPVQQAYPQQGYAQPVASTPTPAQQPAAVPSQGYYGTYY